MRTLLKKSVLPLVLPALLVVGACAKDSKPSTALNDDLKRDLQLAKSSSLDLATQQASSKFPLTEEIQPSSAPAKAPVVKKATSGTKAVRSEKPTVKAAPEPTVAAAESPAPQVEVAQSAPAPTAETTPEPAAPAVPRPTSIPVSTGNGGGQGQQPGVGGGSVLGGIIGVVIRGGGVDGDHCEPHPRGGRGGVYSGGVYGRGYPRPGGGTMPFPINPMVNPRGR